MKRIIQKFFSLVISMALVMSLISVTAMADVTEPITPYAADFQTRTDGETYTLHNRFPNLGRGADMWYADSAGVKGSSDVAVSGGDYDPIRFFDRGDGNIALRMGTSKTYDKSYYTRANILPPTDKAIVLSDGQGDIFRVKADMMAEDKNNDKLLNIRFDDDSTAHHIINLDNDGYIYVWGTKLGAYDVNTWYEFDIYLDFDTKLIYVYINGKLNTILKETNYITKNGVGITYLQLSSQIAAGTIGGMCFDNIEISEMSASHVPSNKAEVSKFKKYLYTDNYSAKITDGSTTVLQIWEKQYSTSKAGMFGKLSSDKSLNLYNDGTGKGISSMDITSQSYASNGETLHISTLVAYSEGSSSTKTIKSQYAETTLLAISPDGKAAAFGSSMPDMKGNQWYRYDYIIKTVDTNSYSIDVYVNGVLQKQGITNKNSRFLERFRHTISGIDPATADDGFWIDNTLVAAYSSDFTPSIQGASLTSEDSLVTLGGADTIYAPENYTVSDFVANITANMPYEIRTKAGATAADDALLSGNFVVFKPSLGGEIYYNVKDARDANYNIKVTYDKENDDTLTLTGGTSAVKEAGHGISDNANFITVDENGIAKLAGSFCSTLCPTADGTTVEMDIFTPKDTTTMTECFVGWKDQGGYRRPLVRFGVGGSVQKVSYPEDKEANETVTDTGYTWEPGRWYHISAFLPSDYGEARVYINGNYIHNVSTARSNQNMNYIGVRATGAGSVIGVNNVLAYSGRYETEESAQDKTVYISGGYQLLADNKKCEVYVPEYDAASKYFPSDALIYSADLSQKLDTTSYTLCGGEKVIAKSKSGKSIGYYTLKLQSEAEVFGVKQAGVFVAEDYITSDGGNMEVAVYDEENAYVIAAQYSAGGEMVALDTSNPGEKHISDITIHEETVKIKFMCFGSSENITPVKVAKKLNVN